MKIKKKRAIKFIGQLILVLMILTTIMGGIAFAKAGPHQGPFFPENTDACANCHRMHTALGTYLITETSVFAFCTSCHNGTGANTNVIAGIFEGTVEGFNTHNHGEAGEGLNAGGFLNAFYYTGRSTRNTEWKATTSRHRINGLDNDGTFTAWGGGLLGPGTEMNLDCISCHNPHGTENSDGSDRYRILRNTVNGKVVGTIKSHESDHGATDYTKIQHKEGIVELCSACHTQYDNKSSWYDAGDGQGFTKRVRHTVPTPISNGDIRTGNGRPIAENLNNNIQVPVEQDTYTSQIKGSDSLTCLTCHQVHGTSSEVSDRAKVAPANSSTLLRLSGRRVCQNCHQR